MVTIKDKPKLFDYFKAGLISEIVGILLAIMLTFIGLGTLALAGGNIGAIQALGMMIILMPVMWIIRGFIWYWIARVVYKR